jgi:glutamate-1-semialdehyde 2,1-aminomutase
LGKILGGGLPLAAFGGRADLMNLLAPSGPVYQAGTLSGNPLATAAGAATLRQLRPQTYQQLELAASSITAAVATGAEQLGVNLQVNRVGSMWTMFFNGESVRDANTARASDSAQYAQFFHAALASDVYLPPSQFEACFVSSALLPPDVGWVADRLLAALSKIRS